MTPRLTKQIIYGTSYLVFFGLIVCGIYLLWLQPAPTCFDNRQNDAETGVDCGGPCEPCEIKTLSPLELSQFKYFPVSDKDIGPNAAAAIIAVEIKNLNQNYGADRFSYSLNIYGKSSGQIKNIMGSSYIYAGEIKYLFETTDVDAQNIGDIKMDFSDVDWKSKEEFPEPVIQTREIKTLEADPKKGGVVVSGFVANNNAFTLSKLRALAFVFDKDGGEISAAKTELDNIPSFGEAPFSINFPSNVSLIKTGLPTPQALVFARDLTLGSRGKDVLELERFLKNQDFFDNEPDEYFGTATRDALIKYQNRVGISQANGYFGAKTRDDINALMPKASLPPSQERAVDPPRTKVYVEAIR